MQAPQPLLALHFLPLLKCCAPLWSRAQYAQSHGIATLIYPAPKADPAAGLTPEQLVAALTQEHQASGPGGEHGGRQGQRGVAWLLAAVERPPGGRVGGDSGSLQCHHAGSSGFVLLPLRAIAHILPAPLLVASLPQLGRAPPRCPAVIKGGGYVIPQVDYVILAGYLKLIPSALVGAGACIELGGGTLSKNSRTRCLPSARFEDTRVEPSLLGPWIPLG